MESNKKLRRLADKSVIGGVAAGVADYFGTDVALVRVIFVLLLIFGKGFPIILIYVILWAALPKEYAGFGSATVYDASGTQLDDRKARNMKWGGYALLAVGGCLLIDELDIIFWPDFDQYFWPIAFIVGGLYLIIGRKKTYDEPPMPPIPTNPDEQIQP